MTKILTHMVMSLDGYIAQPDDNPAELFDWYWAGDETVTSYQDDMSFRVDAASAEMLRELIRTNGCMIAGRHLFDITNGWGDQHPASPRVVVVTHEPPADAATTWPRTVFVPSVEGAVSTARDIAGDKDVIIASPTIAQQALDLGLVDEVCISLAPVLLGEGKPYFTKLDRGHVLFDDPVVVPGQRALHLRYPVRR